MRALYKIVSSETQPKNKGNAGLWYDKYCDEWPEIKWSLKSYKAGNKEFHPKQNWIDKVTGKVGNGDELTEACNRLRELAKAQGAEDVRFFSTQWRFVTGLGREHPVENGFAWHHTLGVPYLPGSSVKGMVRAWAEQWEDIDKTESNRIFGPEGAGKVGSVIFFDAIPTDPVRLEADIMTPHYAPYYSDGEAPGDWHDPTPIPFLTVAAKQPFQFAIAPRNSNNKDDAAQAREWLKEALGWIGAGAKTAVGYGRFKPTGSSEPIETVTWKNAVMRYSPGSRMLTAYAEGKTAEGKNDALEQWIKNQSKATKKKLKKGELKRDVEVSPVGNGFTLLNVLDPQ